MFSERNEPIAIRRIFSGLVTLGFITILGQLLIIREFLNVFQGNELIIGLIFFSWMILTAAGSSFAKHKIDTRKHNCTKILFVTGGFSPLVVVILLQFLRFWFVTEGTQGDLTTFTLFSFLLLFPGCFISGMLFTQLSSMVTQIARENRISACYGFESSGSVLAGLLFSIGIGYLLTSFQLLVLIFSVNLILFPLTFRVSKVVSYSIFFLSAISLLLILVYPPDQKIRSHQFKGQQLVLYKDTPYGSVAVTKNSDQYNIYGNSTLFFSSADNLIFEEAIHFTLLQRPDPEKVMIVSGGMQGMIREVKKYKSVKEIDYVEINPALIEAEHVFSEPFTGKGTNIIIRDARKLIRNTNTKYDAIIVNTPDPSNALINRYFTYEFFDEARRALRPNGILEVALSPTLNYLNNNAISVNSIIYTTLKKAFRNVIIITGEKNYYLASEAPLSNKIVSLLQNTSIINDYVNRFYFDDELIVQKSNMILDQLNSGSSINRDLFPVAYFSQISQWINKSEGDHAPFVMLIIAIIILAIPGIMLFRNIQTLSTPVLTSAFAGASAEFLLVIVFQTLFGYIYLLLGLIVAFYMAGLAVGTLVKFNYRIKSIKIFYLILQMILIVLILFIPLIAYIGIRFPHIPPTVLQGILLLLTAAIALVCGLIYNTASQLFDENSGKIAAKLYMIDLSGGAAGMLLVSFILFPLTGIWGTVIVITGILLSGVVLTMFKAS